MALLSFENIIISGIAVAVPGNTIVNNENYSGLLGAELLYKSIESTGVIKRHVAPPGVCTSDLCKAAAEKLIIEMSVDKSSIDVLIFISQTPDYRIPATACILQESLGLSKKTASFDINLGCSGYVYGLSTAFMFANQPGINRVLLLVGDTVNHFVSAKDRSTALLFGDAGSATIIEKSYTKSNSYFSLNTDGSRFKALNIPAGGYRIPSSFDTLAPVRYQDGSIRNLEQLSLDGGEIFNFSIREVPKDISGLMEFAGIFPDEVDFIIFHQANKFMLDFISKKLIIDKSKYPLSLEEYGNTSSASIPLTIVDKLRERLKGNRKKIVLSGFGVGLSWASAIIEIENPNIPQILFYT